jgi:hypothetical protein
MAGQQQQLTPAQMNALARAAINARAVEMEQQIFATTFASAGGVQLTQPMVTVNPRNVGLIRGFWVKVSAHVTNGSAVQLDLTDFGPANLISQFQFNDLNNNTRIQTTGWHLNLIDSVKSRRPFGAALVNTTGIQSPVNYGANWTQQISAPATIAADGGTGTIIMWFWVPLAYSRQDLRGAIYANVLNATMQLNLTLNPTPFVAAATDSTLAVYKGDVAGSVAAAVIDSMTITVYQNYLDQLPVGNGAVLLPILDLATIYELKNTVVTSIVANQDFPIQYSNFRDFLSTFAVFNHHPANDTGRGVGADINTWALQSANFTNIWKEEPGLIALKTRQMIGADVPPGTYYFPTREKPISTTQYGNMELVLNALTADAGSYALLGYEDFALVQSLSMAGSLAAS